MSEPSTAGPSFTSNAVKQIKGPAGNLGLRASSKETIPSYIARSGFPLLATSSDFVQEISKEVVALLLSFIQAWTTVATRINELGSVELPSPFSTFKDVYVQRGWHLCQTHWSEHQETRLSIYHSFIRVLTDSLRPLLPLQSISDKGVVSLKMSLVVELPAVESLKAIGILFCLKLIQSTTVLSPFDSNFRTFSNRIPIEADLYHILLALPLIAQTSKAFGEWIEKSGLQPNDDVVYILKQMTGDIALQSALESTNLDGYESCTSSDDNDTPVREKIGVFDVLLPTKYDARPALINNRLSTKAETEKEKGIWGHLKSSEKAKDGIGMSRADLMRNLVRQKFELPLRRGKEEETAPSNVDQSLFMDQVKIDKRGHSKDNLAVTIPPSDKAEQKLQECRDDVAHHREKYETTKQQRFDGIDFTSLFPTLGDSTLQSTSPVEPADLHGILASARNNVMHSMHKSMKGSIRDS